MKKLVFFTMMCVAAMSAKAQVLTSETVNNVYEKVINQTEGDFYYNAEMTGKDITTMYVYKNNCCRNGQVTLMPHLKYEYTYAADGTLTSRVAFRWVESQNDWVCAARFDYTLADGKYSAEYSRYNHTTNSFDQPTEKMVYSLMPGDSVNYVSCYYRDNPSSLFQLISETAVIDQFILLAEN